MATIRTKYGELETLPEFGQDYAPSTAMPEDAMAMGVGTPGGYYARPEASAPVADVQPSYTPAPSSAQMLAAAPPAVFAGNRAAQPTFSPAPGGGFTATFPDGSTGHVAAMPTPAGPGYANAHTPGAKLVPQGQAAAEGEQEAGTPYQGAESEQPIFLPSGGGGGGGGGGTPQMVKVGASRAYQGGIEPEDPGALEGAAEERIAARKQQAEAEAKASGEQYGNKLIYNAGADLRDKQAETTRQRIMGKLEDAADAEHALVQQQIEEQSQGMPLIPSILGGLGQALAGGLAAKQGQFAQFWQTKTNAEIEKARFAMDRGAKVQDAIGKVYEHFANLHQNAEVAALATQQAVARQALREAEATQQLHEGSLIGRRAAVVAADIRAQVAENKLALKQAAAGKIAEQYGLVNVGGGGGGMPKLPGVKDDEIIWESQNHGYAYPDAGARKNIEDLTVGRKQAADAIVEVARYAESIGDRADPSKWATLAQKAAAAKIAMQAVKFRETHSGRANKDTTETVEAASGGPKDATAAFRLPGRTAALYEAAAGLRHENEILHQNSSGRPVVRVWRNEHGLAVPYNIQVPSRAPRPMPFASGEAASGLKTAKPVGPAR